MAVILSKFQFNHTTVPDCKFHVPISNLLGRYLAYVKTKRRWADGTPKITFSTSWDLETGRSVKKEGRNFILLPNFPCTSYTGHRISYIQLYKVKINCIVILFWASWFIQKCLTFNYFHLLPTKLTLIFSTERTCLWITFTLGKSNEFTTTIVILKCITLCFTHRNF